MNTNSLNSIRLGGFCRSLLTLAVVVALSSFSATSRAEEAPAPANFGADLLKPQSLTGKAKELATALENTLADGQASQADVAKAIHNLEVLKAQEAACIMAPHISYKGKARDGISTVFPFVPALTSLKDPAVPYVIAFMEKSNSDSDALLAASAVLEIKGSNYKAFVEEIKSKVSAKTYNTLKLLY
ncbi:MAG: hypothetical protein ACAI35_17485 [Candidatus Methylacidiphilales bacterium]|nr:hypothetical protein [Candidatus Methylacidiphilales bacterium]